jgi:hypothetical protein
MWSIAIPSYNRSDVIASKTLKTLECIDRNKITIFVVPEELDLYRQKCPGYQIIPGVKGLVAQREFIENWYPLDSNILFMDDDVSDLFFYTDEKTRQPIENLSQFISDGFLRASEIGATLWGIYPVDNCMFAYKSKEISDGLSYIVGAFYGQKNTRDIKLETGDGVEDRERTILRFLRDSRVLRFNRYGLKTKYFAPGGMMSNERQKIHQIASEALVQKYPALLRLKTRKNGYVDCQIKSQLHADSGRKLKL